MSRKWFWVALAVFAVAVVYGWRNLGLMDSLVFIKGKPQHIYNSDIYNSYGPQL